MSASGISAGGSIGPYQILRELGAGGMGRVYLARSPGGREVAVKVLRTDSARDAANRQRFAAEVAAAQAVAGPFTASVIEADPFAPEPWLATEYVPGPTLEHAVKDSGPFDERRLRELAAGLSEALLEIHKVGVVHRDLKPSNVLMSPGGPRVIDFGISVELSRFGGDAAQSPVGSPGYAAPEQVTGQIEPDRPGDVFSLGAVLAFAATGHGPFGEGAHAALLYRVVHEEPDLQGIPASIRVTVAACLDKDPATRPTPHQVLAALAPEDWLPSATLPESPTVTVTDLPQSPIAPESAISTSPMDEVPVGDTAYEYPRTRRLVSPSLPTMPASGPEPNGAPEDARRGLTRRNVLIGGAVTAAAAGTAGLALLGVDRSEGSPSRGGTTGPAPAASYPTPVVPGEFTLNAGSLPKAPKPEWTASPAKPPGNGQVAALDGTVFWYPTETAAGWDLLAFDAATGRQLWTGSEKAPGHGMPGTGTLGWGGLFGSAFYGYNSGLDASYRQFCYVFGLNAQGDQVVSRDIPIELGSSTSHLRAVVGDVAVVSLFSTQDSVAALSLANGTILWTTPITLSASDESTEVAVTADSTHCYILQATRLTAYGLHDGKAAWAVDVPVYTGPQFVLAGSALIVSGLAEPSAPGAVGFLALDTATGRRLWGTATATPFAAFGSTVYGIGTASGVVTAFDARSGATKWQFESSVLSIHIPSTSFQTSAGAMASANLAAIAFDGFTTVVSTAGSASDNTMTPGFLVLDTATGRARWAYSNPKSIQLDQTSENGLPYVITVSDAAVYAASSTTLYGFKAGA